MTAAQKIVTEICRHVEVALPIVMGDNRKRSYVIARNLSYRLLRRHLSWSYAELGEFFNKDHSSVMHGVKSINNDIASDPVFRERARVIEDAVDKIMDKHKPKVPPHGYLSKRKFALREAIKTYRGVVNWT